VNAAASSTDLLGNSRLVQGLLDHVAWGNLSCPDVQCIAQWILDDLNNPQSILSIEKLAHIGCDNKFAGKRRRVLLKKFGAHNDFPKPFTRVCACHQGGLFYRSVKLKK